MKKRAFEKILAGLNDAIAFAEGDGSRGVLRKIEVDAVDVPALRARLGLSQNRFAALFGISPKTVRNWEQGIRRPEGAARVLLQVIDREPEAVLRALRERRCYDPSPSNAAVVPAGRGASKSG